MEKAIAVFTTTYETLRAEKICIEQKIAVTPVIKPRTISSNCGMALEFTVSQKGKLLTLCRTSNLELVGIFTR